MNDELLCPCRFCGQSPIDDILLNCAILCFNCLNNVSTQDPIISTFFKNEFGEKITSLIKDYRFTEANTIKRNFLKNIWNARNEKNNPFIEPL